jgi:RNA polymerase sigma-54 factor
MSDKAEEMLLRAKREILSLLEADYHPAEELTELSTLNRGNIAALYGQKGDYQKMLENPSLAAGDKAYLRSMIDSGKSLIHSIEQRKTTILRIAELIVNAQYDFMKYGPRALKPMTMRQAADKLGLHETTVSRAVSGKYMLTPVGLFEFKYFFSGGFQSEEGEEVSAQAIKNMIRDLVNAEDPTHPLSDSKLSSLLAEKGFEVARRTIAKYRGQLGIPLARWRKEL